MYLDSSIVSLSKHNAFQNENDIQNRQNPTRSQINGIFESFPETEKEFYDLENKMRKALAFAQQ